MITPKNIKKSQAKHLLKLIEEMTQAEVLARLGRFNKLEYADWYMVSIKKREELLEYIFETSSLVELGKRWGLLGRTGKVRHGKSKKNKKTSD